MKSENLISYHILIEFDTIKFEVIAVLWLGHSTRVNESFEQSNCRTTYGVGFVRSYRCYNRENKCKQEDSSIGKDDGEEDFFSDRERGDQGPSHCRLYTMKICLQFERKGER